MKAMKTTRAKRERSRAMASKYQTLFRWVKCGTKAYHLYPKDDGPMIGAVVGYDWGRGWTFTPTRTGLVAKLQMEMPALRLRSFVKDDPYAPGSKYFRAKQELEAWIVAGYDANAQRAWLNLRTHWGVSTPWTK